MSDSPGKRLLAEREARGLSLEDIARATKIRTMFILALEADDYSQFPSITHARSFLSLYGKYLQVDVKDGMANLATPARIGIENYQYLNVVREHEPNFRTSRRSRSSPPNNGSSSKSYLLAAIFIALLFVVGYLAINLKRLNLTELPAQNTTEATDTPSVNVTNPDGPTLRTNLEKPKPTATPASSPFHVPISENRRLWQPERTPLE